MSYRFSITVIRVHGFGDAVESRHIVADVSGQSLAVTVQKARDKLKPRKLYKPERDMLTRCYAIMRDRSISGGSHWGQLAAGAKVIDWGAEVRILRYADQFGPLGPVIVDDWRE